MTVPLHAVTTDERPCPAKRITPPARQCELIAGHEGLHSAHGWDRQQLITWRTGSSR